MRVGARKYVWIKAGILHLPVNLPHPILVLTSGKMLQMVTMETGRQLMFMRAADMVDVAPEMLECVKLVAKRFECSL